MRPRPTRASNPAGPGRNRDFVAVERLNGQEAAPDIVIDEHRGAELIRAHGLAHIEGQEAETVVDVDGDLLGRAISTDRKKY